ncbi:GNAT family N-acetyltransferase [Alkalibacillus silvisoli]|uniref:GNAT family N-acetyltransferase n=1 Tax=Alkalibacillus silvisoli TaxID=392823 RepID=A0ABN0ZQ26_9BACI
MVKFKNMSEEEIDNVSKFIAMLNNMEESHIGFCGKDHEEIKKSMIDDIEDIDYTNSFIVAHVKDQLVGVLGFDYDLEDRSAEIWGPFIKEGYWEIAIDLWEQMVGLLPNEIESLHKFPNKRNLKAQKLAENVGFSKQSKEIVLAFEKHNQSELSEQELVELTENDYDEMKTLHDEVFPKAYYSGQRILNRLNGTRKVLIITNEQGFAGYVYVEAEPEFEEGSIEFFAVKESERGKGYGEFLLTAALKWLFTFETISSIDLCVNSGNEKAIKLYERIGFKRVHDLYSFTNER